MPVSHWHFLWVCSEIWNLIDPQNKDELKNAEPKHLFWVLLFLKTYCTEPVLRRVVGGVDGGTFRVWTWKFVKEASDLKPRVIIFSNRFNQWNGTAICVISVDGTDCAIQEPYPYSTGIFSEKLNGPGLKYEIGHIVWVDGPFDASRHDVTIFKEDI
jgi:hypothetical protein